MPPPEFRFHVPAQILPDGETSTSWLLVVPKVYVVTNAGVPLQVFAVGCAICCVCPNASDMPVVCGVRKMEATLEVVRPYPRPLQKFACGLRVQPEIDIPAGMATHNKQISVKNRRMNPPRPASSNRGTVSRK